MRRLSKRVRFVPFNHSTTSPEDSKRCGYTWSRTCCAREAEAVEHLRVLLRRVHAQHRVEWRAAVERAQEGLFLGDFTRDDMRRVVGVRGHLYGELAVVGERVSPTSKHALVIRDPVQCRVRHDHIEAVRVREVGEVTLPERQPVSLQLVRLSEHLRRRVDANGLARRERGMRLRGELTCSATEVGDAGACDIAFDQRQQVEERLRPLGAEPVVLLRIPGIGHSITSSGGT